MDIAHNLVLVPYYISANGTLVDYTQVLAGFEYRTMSDIVRICLLTTLVYTWAALHSNIPPRRGLCYRTWYRANLVLVAFVMPDLIVLWAAKQYWASRALVMQYKGTYRLCSPYPFLRHVIVRARLDADSWILCLDGGLRGRLGPNSFPLQRQLSAQAREGRHTNAG